jgi:hypothetical protein
MKTAILMATMLLGCASAGGGFLAAAGTVGPIAVTADGKSTVTLKASAVQGVPPNCIKPVSVDFVAPNWSTSCSASIPVPQSADALCK